MARAGQGKNGLTPAEGSGMRTQYGALCWRMHRGRVEVLLVTSRDTGRWIIPKGWPIAGLAPEAVAAREAWEEAGVEGMVHPVCAGLYAYDKALDDRTSVPCAVAVYPVRVGGLVSKFPERKQRQRKWFAQEKAARKVDEPELRALIGGFQPVEMPTGPIAADPDDRAAPTA